MIGCTRSAPISYRKQNELKRIMKHRFDFFVCNSGQFVHIVLVNQQHFPFQLASRVPTVLTATTVQRKKRATTVRASDHPTRSFLPKSWRTSCLTCSAETFAHRAATSILDKNHQHYLRTATDTLFDRVIDVTNRPHDHSLLHHVTVTHYIHNDTHSNASPSSRFSPTSFDSSYPAKRQQKTLHYPRNTSRSASPCIRLSLTRFSLLPDCRIHSSCLVTEATNRWLQASRSSMSQSPSISTRFIAWLHQRQQIVHTAQLRHILLSIVQQGNSHRLPRNHSPRNLRNRLLRRHSS